MFRLLISTLIMVLSSLAAAQPITNAFTFQGQLQNGGSPVSGTYDIQFRLFDSATGGGQLGPTLCSDNIAITSGQVTTQLDFGSQFIGQQRFLEISIRQDTGLDCSNITGFTTLSPRQQLTATPNSLFSVHASSASTATTAQSATTATTATNATQFNGQPPSFYTNAANLTGSLPSADFSGTYDGQLSFSNAGNTFQGAFSGSGAGLTNLPWSSIIGAPATILLQSTSPGTAQSGNLNLTGRARSGSASIGTTNSTYPLEVGGGPVHVIADGDVLRFGSGTSLAGLSTEVNSQLLNLDVNFRLQGSSTNQKGAAIRLDARTGSPAIQFFTRAASSSVENTVLTIDDIGQTTITSTGGTGLSASSNAIGGHAISANAASSSGYTMGIFSQVNSPNGNAVVASSNSTSGPTRALYCLDNSPSGCAAELDGNGADAVVVYNNSSGRGIHVTTSHDTAIWAEAGAGLAGVDGRTNLSTGFGVIGQALATTGVNYGVRGVTASSAAGYGVFSVGTMAATGVKAFRIDHPADPEHKYLLHYCTESPEVLNAYSGKVTLNQQGEATIDLPAYFARINKDPRYLLTPIGAAMPLLHVAEEVSDDALEQGAKAAPQDQVPTCSFTIAGGAPNAKVCWRVEAVRNDRWVQTHGAPVEVNKQGPEDGTYQHPDLYNQPAEMGLNAARATR